MHPTERANPVGFPVAWVSLLTGFGSCTPAVCYLTPSLTELLTTFSRIKGPEPSHRLRPAKCLRLRISLKGTCFALVTISYRV